jgi:hypothetical protein
VSPFEAGEPKAFLYILIENAKRQGVDSEKWPEEAISLPLPPSTEVVPPRLVDPACWC